MRVRVPPPASHSWNATFGWLRRKELGRMQQPFVGAKAAWVLVDAASDSRDTAMEISTSLTDVPFVAKVDNDPGVAVGLGVEIVDSVARTRLHSLAFSPARVVIMAADVESGRVVLRVCGVDLVVLAAPYPLQIPVDGIVDGLESTSLISRRWRRRGTRLPRYFRTRHRCPRSCSLSPGAPGASYFQSLQIRVPPRRKCAGPDEGAAGTFENVNSGSGRSPRPRTSDIKVVPVFNRMIVVVYAFDYRRLMQSPVAVSPCVLERFVVTV